MLLRSAYFSEITIIGTIITELLVLNLPSFKNSKVHLKGSLLSPGGLVYFKFCRGGLLDMGCS